MNVFSLLDSDVSNFLQSSGIQNPTDIQSKAIPAILEDRKNVLLLAPTGSGKTEAALLPLLHKLYKMKEEQELFGFYVLYITPLRALNRDVFKRIEELCSHLGITVAVRHGDTTQYARRKQAIRPPNLLITTPETLQAILPGKRLRYHLKTVFAVIVDEVHEMADGKRGVQLSLGLERLERLAGNSIQRIGLSATVGNPKDVAELLVGNERDVHTFWAGYQSRETEMTVEMPEPSSDDKKLARRISYPPHSTARMKRIMELIESHKSTLVFTNTRSFAEVLGSKIRILSPAFEFDVHHGSLSKDVRLEAEDRLKNGISKAIVATSSLELGIDIGQADLVVQYSSPREVSRILQRVGRSGHGVGRVSKGIIIATANLDDILESGVILRRARANKVENAKIPEKAWDVLSQQVAGILLDIDEIDFNELFKLVQQAQPFKKITEIELRSILNFLEERKTLRVENGLVKRYKRTRSFYYEHLSTIPDVQQVRAVDMASRRSIGVLDETFVESMDLGSVFVIRGRPWKIVSVDDDKEEVLCAPVVETEVEAPRWIGEMIPVPYEVASEVAKVWNLIDDSESVFRKQLEKEYRISINAQNHVISTIIAAKEAFGTLPSNDRVIIEKIDDGIVVHIALGTRANETLGVVLGALLTTQLGIEVAVERDPYRVLFTTPGGIDADILPEILRTYDTRQIVSILRIAVKQTQNFASRFVHVGRRMGIIRRDAKIHEIPVQRLIKSYENSPVFTEAMNEVLRDKLDEKRIIELFQKIADGKMEIIVVKTKRPSSFARLIIEEKTRFEVMGEISEEDEVLKMMEDRLMSKKFRLVCMGNVDWNSVRTLSTLDDKIFCPICDSSMVAAVSTVDQDFVKIVKNHAAGNKLSREEYKKYRTGALTASLVSEYGKVALLILAGRGIGPQTASRILNPQLTDRLTILRTIAKAEKQYERTRPFWD